MLENGAPARSPRYMAADAQLTRAALARIQSQFGPPPPVRIGWLSTWGSRCGIAAHSFHLSAHFAAGTLSIFAPSNERPESADADHVRRLWRLGHNDFQALKQAVVQERLQALIIQYNWAFFSPMALANLCESLRRRGIRVVVEMHNTRSAPPKMMRPECLDPLGQAARIIVHSLDDVRRLEHWGLSGNVTLLPLCIYDIPRPSAAERLAARRKRGLASAVVLATYGYLMPHKGLGLLIEALPALLARHPQLHLLMINAWYSTAASDPELNALHTRIQRLGLGSHITLQTDYLTDIDCMAQLSLADLVVFPYQYSKESSSAAVRFAISARRPTAVTPLAFFQDVASVTYLLPGTDPASLAEGIAALLDKLAIPGVADHMIERLDRFAEQHGSGLRSRQLESMITSILRQS
jgi:glycosyltransferase involved in cell wall biosynthesis